MTAFASARDIIGQILVDGLKPIPPKPFVDWLEENLVLVDGPLAGENWSRHSQPALVGVAKCLSEESSYRHVTVRKGQQTGVSIMAIGWCLYIAERMPGNILYAVPGTEALRDLSANKMQPSIDKWQDATKKRIIASMTARSGDGSTVMDKRFAGGYLKLANANAAMDLSSHTARFGVKDELSKWEDIPGKGDPETLFWGRFTAFRKTGSYRILDLSTPEIDTGDELGDAPGHCRIDREFKRSDQRFYHLECPQCGELFVQDDKYLKIDRDDIDSTVHANPCCGYPMTEAERVKQLVPEADRWIASVEEPGHAGFHFDAFISTMMSYGEIARDRLKAESGSERDEKDYHNLVLALPYQMRGNAPEYERLMERREDYPENIVPARGLIFVGAIDVQHNGLYAQAKAYACNRESWVVTARFFEGDTTDPKTGAWAEASKFIDQLFECETGDSRRMELVVVDVGDGQRATATYQFVRTNGRVRAVHGVAGWSAPAYGTATKRTVNGKGKKGRYSVMSWPVGTWSIKSEIYANMNKTGVKSGADEDPGGYPHFGNFLDENHFRQMTAESLEQRKRGGRFVREWVEYGPNHMLDCTVYCDAAAEMLGLTSNSPSKWAERYERYGKSIERAPDLFSPGSEPVPPANQADSLEQRKAAIRQRIAQRKAQTKQ